MSSETSQALQRALTQQLDGLLRAGLTHLPRAAMPDPEPAVASAAGKPALKPFPAAPRRPAETSDSAETMAASSRSRTPARSASPATTAPAVTPPAVPPAAPLPLKERVAQLKILADTVAKCVRCEELARTRTQTVFGVGDPQAKILFIGEAPGADEDATGEPFVGKAGQLLNKIIEASKLKREDIYICNILKCRPPGNRLPQPVECANCREYLDGQLRIVDPDYIVCWGTVAAQNLLATPVTIGKLRGRFHQHGRAKVLCTYHPSYLLRNPAAKKDVWEDMKFLMADMGVTL